MHTVRRPPHSITQIPQLVPLRAPLHHFRLKLTRPSHRDTPDTRGGAVRLRLYSNDRPHTHTRPNASPFCGAVQAFRPTTASGVSEVGAVAESVTFRGRPRDLSSHQRRVRRRRRRRHRSQLRHKVAKLPVRGSGVSGVGRRQTARAGTISLQRRYHLLLQPPAAGYHSTEACRYLWHRRLHSGQS